MCAWNCRDIFRECADAWVESMVAHYPTDRKMRGVRERDAYLSKHGFNVGQGRTQFLKFRKQLGTMLPAQGAGVLERSHAEAKQEARANMGQTWRVVRIALTDVENGNLLHRAEHCGDWALCHYALKHAVNEDGAKLFWECCTACTESLFDLAFKFRCTQVAHLDSNERGFSVACAALCTVHSEAWRTGNVTDSSLPDVLQPLLHIAKETFPALGYKPALLFITLGNALYKAFSSALSAANGVGTIAVPECAYFYEPGSAEADTFTYVAGCILLKGTLKSRKLSGLLHAGDRERALADHLNEWVTRNR